MIDSNNDLARVLVMGDLAPVGMAEEAIRREDASWFSSGLEPVWLNSDFRVANLECPLVAKFNPLQKIGPCLGVVADSAKSLAGFSLLGLANNHILDHSAEGLLNTVQLLDEAGIPYVGAGRNLEAAGTPHIAEIDGVRVGFLAWSHREFCLATTDSPGAFPIDLTIGLTKLEQLKRQCDFVVLLYHGGPEHFPYPTPQQRQLCQFLARRGADFIFCQHSHIVGALEAVAGSTIFYGQGNYCFDLPRKRQFKHWCSGIACEIEFSKTEGTNYKIIPTVHSLDDGLGPALAQGEQADSILAAVEHHSAVLADEEKFKLEWQAWSKRTAEEFLIRQVPLGRIGRKILKMTGIAKLLATPERMLWNLNRIECEAHSETIAEGLVQLAKQQTATGPKI